MSTATLPDYSSYALKLSLGVFAIVRFTVKREPVLRSIGITLDRGMPVDLGLGFVIPFAAISLAFAAALLLGAITAASGSPSPFALNWNLVEPPRTASADPPGAQAIGERRARFLP